MQLSKWLTLGFGAFCLVSVAGFLNAPHLYYMAAILLTLPGVSYALGWNTLRGLEFNRTLPSTAWEGEESEIVYEVRNSTPLARFFLAIHEALPTWITPLDAEPPLFNAAANDTTRVVHRVRFQRRGVFQVQAFDVTATDPLGVFAFTRRVVCDGELIVYPRPQTVDLLSLSGTDRYGWLEFTSAVMRGSSVDPDGVRPYAPGDSLRRIHWRQTARTGKLSVIEFEESQSVNLVIALDAQRGSEVGSGAETTLEYAIRLAASIAQLAYSQGAGVRLLLPPMADMDTMAVMTAAGSEGRGGEHFYWILEALARVEATALQPVSAVLDEALGTLQPGTTLLVITGQQDAGLPEAAVRYTVAGANVTVAYVDPETFRQGRRNTTSPIDSRFFAELLSAPIRLYVVPWNAHGTLLPEAVANVH